MKKIVIRDGEGVVVEKKSRFIGEVHSVSDEAEAQSIVAAVKKSIMMPGITVMPI